MRVVTGERRRRPRNRIWFVAPLAVPGAGDRAGYIFAGVLAPASLIGLWLVRPRSRGSDASRAPSAAR